MREIDVAELYKLVKKEALQVESELHLLAEIMLQELDIRWYLKERSAKKADRLKVIRQLLPQASASFQSLVELLVAKELINQVPVLADRFSEMVTRQTGKQFLEIKSAQELPESSQAKLRKKYGTQYRVLFAIDKNIIGGLRLKWEDGRYFDATVAGELEALKEAILV